MRSPIILVFLIGCVDLDSFVHNPRHCSIVGEDTCTDIPASYDPDWDPICVPCETPYDLERDYNWIDGMLTEGQSVRSVADTLIVRESLATEDGEGELDLIHIASHGENPTTADLTILYNHGNFAGLEHYLPRIRMLHEAGYGVLAWDYRGYGKSQPETVPTAEQFMADARQVATYADVPPSQLVSYGYSVGAIPAVEMALTGEACALILEAPFTSQAQNALANSGTALPGTFLSSGHFENTEKIRDYEGPLLVMTGTRDKKFPTEDVRSFVTNAGGESAIWILEGIDHGIGGGGGVPEASLTDWMNRIQTFFDEEGKDCTAL